MAQAARVRVPAQPRLIVDNVSWREYLHFLRAFNERPAYRLTYDRGVLEIMIVSYEHGGYGNILGRLLETLTEELELPVAGGANTTFKRHKKKRGLEPDECYWIANEALVRGKKRLDLRVDPPPDIAVEVDVTHSSLNRMGIYAALGVPEVWRYSRGTFSFYLLNAAGKYDPSSGSPNFPGLTDADVLRFVSMQGRVEQNSLVRQFRTWIREQIAAGVLRRPGA